MDIEDNVVSLRPSPRDPRREAERTILRMVADNQMKIPADEMVPILARALIELLDASDAPQG